MPELEPMPARSLERHAGLRVAATYERRVPAAIELVWENVFDWEHLPWLHDQAFTTITLRETGDWGWAAEIGLPGGGESEIELVVDSARSRYVARTRTGQGAGNEIWTTLTDLDGEATDVRVEFWLAPLEEPALRALGEAFRGLYAGLWDQDESMILERREAMAARAARAAGSPSTGPERVDLGPIEALRPTLPRVVELDGHRYRLIEVDADLVAHSVLCPHWLGPLDGCDPAAKELVCPWHGYRFDPRSGESTDGRGLRLRRAPRVEVDAASGRVWLVQA